MKAVFLDVDKTLDENNTGETDIMIDLHTEIFLGEEILEEVMGTNVEV